MCPLARWERFPNFLALHDQLGRILEEGFFRSRSGESALTAWSPAVDIFETEDELVAKADLPEIDEKALDIRVENNTLSIRGERKLEKALSEDNFLRVERAFGSFSRSFSLPNTVNAEAIRAEYRNGVVTVTLPKREESKPRQIKVSLNSHN